MTKLNFRRMFALFLFAASTTVVFSSSKEANSFSADSYLNSTSYVAALCINNGYSTIEHTYFGGTWAMLCNCDAHKGDVGSKCVEETVPID